MRILIAGDFCPRSRIEALIENNGYEFIFGEVRDLIEKTDYSIVNFECSVIKEQAKPIEKSGPNLKCSVKGVEAVKYAGFNCVTLANNHFLDYGEKGVKDTIATLKEKGVDYVGGGMNLEEASRILYREIKGQILAVINCCEHEFSIATELSAGSNPLNPIKQYYAIQEARRNADKVIVIVHGGDEHVQIPSIRMVETYRFFIDAGADAVVNHHQHCYSGYEIYKGNPIFYGLGNFCFDNPLTLEDLWTEGFSVILNLNDKDLTFSIHPYSQCAESPCIKLLESDAFDVRLKELNSIIIDRKKLTEEIHNYYKSKSFLIGWMFEPFRNGLFFRLRHQRILPSLLRKRDKLYFRNQLLCESYYDRVKWWLEQTLK